MKVAIVGAGATGIAASYFLNEHSGHEVHLFEAAEHAGGHAHALPFPSLESRSAVAAPKSPDSDVAWTETGFVVFNPITYPNFCNFLDKLEIRSLAADISWSFSRGNGAYEWCSRGLRGVFVQRKNLCRSRHWRMLWDMLRFNVGAIDILRKGGVHTETIGAYLERNGYSIGFREDYLMPFVSAIWATPPDEIALDFPISSLVRYMYNHHLLQAIGGSQWRTVEGSSRAYIDRVLSRLPAAQQHFSTPVHSVESVEGCNGSPVLTLTTAHGEVMQFDHVIMACHADQVREILARGEGLTREEDTVLSGFTFSDNNHVVVHSDVTLMPSRPEAWCAWNYLSGSSTPEIPGAGVSLTFWMNRLQKIPQDRFGIVLCSLNPPVQPHPDLVIGEYNYKHPHMTAASNAARTALPTIQNRRGITFAGAWSGYGFHEDAITSAMRVVSQHLGVRLPFEIQVSERSLPDKIGYALENSLLAVAERIRGFLVGYRRIYRVFRGPNALPLVSPESRQAATAQSFV